MISLKKLILEQISYTINSDSDIDSDIESYGVSISEKDVSSDGKYYQYVISGDSDSILRLVMHVNGPKGFRRDRTAINMQGISLGSENFGVW